MVRFAEHFAEHKVVDVQPVPDLAVELARWEADRRACRHDGPGRGEGLRR
jgi:hypothetical protein